MPMTDNAKPAGNGNREPQQTLAQLLHNRRLIRHRTFLAYAYDSLVHTSLWLQWKQLLAHLRRVRTVALILRILTFLFHVLQTGTLVLLATALFVIVIPIGSAIMLGILLTALIESRHTNRRLRAEIGDKRACILFFSPHTESTFLWHHAQDLAARGYAVFLISPYWIASHAPISNRYYVTARTLAPHVHLIRRYYFFSLRRHVLKNGDTLCIY